MTETTTDRPRIYVADLAAYNAGILHGEWIDATQDADEIEEDVRAMLAESPTALAEGLPAEEWAIHDYGGFGGIKLSEWEPFENVSALAHLIEEYGAPFAAWFENDPRVFGADDAMAASMDFEEAYQGEWDSLEDYAYEVVKRCGYLEGVPNTAATYFDYRAFGRDLRLGGDVWTADAGGGAIYVFLNV